ncbi:MAG TPA: FecR domain-containing protein [Bryobacteraceae bacterium]|nr:FecR domain-containing protein [Bryobacteraceae bacterium]
MNERYLWDRTGPPDEEVAHLERMLGTLRYKHPVVTRRKIRWPIWFAGAAAAVICVGIIGAMLSRHQLTEWRFDNGRQIRTGQTIETGDLHGTRIEARDAGEVTVDPASRLRLVRSRTGEHFFDLRQGTIHAFIWAPAGQFVVDTPSSKAVDLGCRYTLQVSQNGNGLLTVEMGLVAFERDGVESFIPAGASCVTRRDRGPGTPYFGDATTEMKTALNRFDTTGNSTAFADALTAARPRDALSLWHLMTRTQGERRAEVFDRMASLVSLPPEANRELILRSDRGALDAAWDSLHLGDAAVWRKWRRRW